MVCTAHCAQRWKWRRKMTCSSALTWCQLCAKLCRAFTTTPLLAAALGEYRERAATDVARYGLRRCALPSCSATEPEPKFFKLCGRCRGVAYCSAAHSKEDWKRHKREEGCQAAPGGS
jgi:hypothetical protein